MSVLFSIILPIYKVEKYIAKCIESCCCQTGVDYDQYELVLVDDSTPDGSIDIARQVLEKHVGIRYRIVRRPNGGLSAARNTGIENSRGEYLWFVDSDDFISNDALLVLSEYIKGGNNYDIIRFRHNIIYINGIEDNNDLPSMKSIESDGYDLLRRHRFLSVWGGVYRHSFVNGHRLRFKEGRIWEDSEFNIRAYSLADKCLEIGNSFYNYIRRETSISAIRATPFAITSRLQNANDLITFFEKEKDLHKLSIVATHICGGIIASIAGLREMGNEAMMPFRSQIIAQRHTYLQWAKLASDKRIWMVLWLYGFIPQAIERFLSYRIHKVIKRSQHL